MNLLLVAFLGCILRYKILFPFPLIDQKHLLHAHSHFAFAGWVSQVLMVLMIRFLLPSADAEIPAKYKKLLVVNLVTAYGMLIFFTIEGYGLLSIIFSTAAIFNSWIFSYLYWKDLKEPTFIRPPVKWFKAALVFNVLSSSGAFALAYMMANKIIHQNWYLAAVYFYLHFQYNGWFFFACMGLAIERFSIYITSAGWDKKIFQLFSLACIPAYFLSALWMDIPGWVFLLVVLAAVSQVLGWIIFLKKITETSSIRKFTIANERVSQTVLLLAALALTIKLVLQLLSTIPALSTLAFGFRPIVIGYLHLILLGVITLFVIGYLLREKIILSNAWVTRGIIVFTTAVIINECFLMTQGAAAILGNTVPYINECLLVVAFLLFTGMLLLNLGIKKQS